VTLFSYSAGLLGFLSMSDNLPRTLNTGDKAVYLGRIKEQVRASEWWSTNLVELDAVERNGEWNALHHTVLLMAEREGNLFLEGDRILFHGRLEEIRNPGNPGEFDQQQYWHSKGVRYQGFVYSEGLRIVDSEGVGTVQELFITIRQYASELIDRFVGDQYGAIVKALLLGD